MVTKKDVGIGILCSYQIFVVMEDYKLLNHYKCPFLLRCSAVCNNTSDHSCTEMHDTTDMKIKPLTQLLSLTSLRITFLFLMNFVKPTVWTTLLFGFNTENINPSLITFFKSLHNVLLLLPQKLILKLLTGKNATV